MQQHLSQQNFNQQNLQRLPSTTQQQQLAQQSISTPHPPPSTPHQAQRMLSTSQQQQQQAQSQPIQQSQQGLQVPQLQQPQPQHTQPQPQVKPSPKPIGTTSSTVTGAFKPEQLEALRYQIHAFKLITRNLAVPELLQREVFKYTSSQSIPETSKPANAIASKIVEAVYNQNVPPNVNTSRSSVDEKQKFQGPFWSIASNPYNHLPKSLTAQAHASRQQRLLIPSIMPTGLDPEAYAEERERRIQARIQYRIQELENLPANLASTTLSGHAEGSAKLKAMIELKALRLLDKQRQLRQQLIQGVSKSTTLHTAADRNAFRRMKKQSLREARNTEKMEKQQRSEREKRQKQKQAEYLASIVSHGRELVNWHRVQASKTSKLALQVQRFHVIAEKEEQKRIQRISQERLQALKADDEEAYLKLIDTTKDTRITHLLRQTNTYLETLSAAVVSQKESIAEGEALEIEDEDAYRTEHGDDYYAISHRVQEEIKSQPSILVGGKLKEYQIKGLQWMISLYNNRLNGILADEMGLGKTIQSISLITYLIEKKKQNGPFLIIVPLSTLTNWTLEFEKWAPSVVKVVYKGVPSTRRQIQLTALKQGFNVLLTTYEYIIKDRPVLSKFKWVHMIIDEGHRMKNANSKLTYTLTTYYHARYRLILTGTPLQVCLHSIMSLLSLSLLSELSFFSLSINFWILSYFFFQL